MEIGISEDRQKHSIEVARTMKRLAKELYDWDEEKCEAMFTLGYLHDIGYEYATIPAQHQYIGGMLMKKCNYTYWKEILNHGKTGPLMYNSPELDLLNVADMITDSKGNTVTVEEKLTDILKRYGEQSSQYQNAKQIAAYLKTIFKGLNLV